MCLEKENSSVILLSSPIHHFPLLPLCLLSSQLNQPVFLFVSAAVTQPALRGEMEISQTEIFQHSNFRSPKLKCVNGELPLPAVVVLFFYTHCKKTQSQTLGSDQTTGEKKIIPAAAAAMTVSAFIILHLHSPISDIPSAPLPYPFSFSLHFYVFITFLPSLVSSPSLLLFLWTCEEARGGEFIQLRD